MIDRGINEGHPPSTGEWNEFEARQPDLVPQRRPAFRTQGRRVPPPIPVLTPEQIAHHATQLHAAALLMVEALDRELWDARWTNRLMQAHTIARSTLIHAGAWQPPEAVAASDSPSDSGESDPQRESETTAVEACRTSPEA
jgi:hypothetical protein